MGKGVILPNFLIVGAAKSGTTSAYVYLRNHPQVFMPARKEPTFFACPEAGGITDEAEYLALFGEARGKRAIGEASVAYLYDRDAPRRIYGLLGPSVKIVIFLRNPVDMAYSLWGHQVREGGEGLSFTEALAQESSRMKSPEFAEACFGWGANYAYKERAKYAEQVERYYDTFEASNIKVFVFEEFFRAGLPQYAELCRFLGIADQQYPEIKIHNAAGTVRSKWLRRVLSERMIWKEPIKLVLPKTLRDRLTKAATAYNRQDRPLPRLDPELRSQLEREFSSDMARLEKVLRRRLGEFWFLGAEGRAETLTS